MAISFNCPHCLEAYRLPDKLGGKQAKCKNPECRQQITIPKAITISDEPKMSAEEAEAAALAALNEDAPVAQQTAAPAEKMVPVVCKFCDHKWTEPLSKAGKNVLCPNPECRQRIKVPEPKEEKAADWRNQNAHIPEGVRTNIPKLEGVVSADEITYVRPESLQKADATGIEYEPRPLKQVIMMWAVPVVLLLGVGLGIWFYLGRRTAVNEEQLMADAKTELTNTKKEWESGSDKTDPKVEWATKQAGLYSAVLNLAATEYALRHDTAEKTKASHGHFRDAINDLRSVQGPERDAIVAELVFTVLTFAGTDEQAKEQIRYRWTPDTESGRYPRMNEQVRTIHGELQTTLRMLAEGNFEFRMAVARRLTRELTRQGHADIAADLIPQTLFADPQRNEARAAIALEIHRTDGSSPLPRTIADDLKRQFASGVSGAPHPVSAHILFGVLKIEKPPLVIGQLPQTGIPASSDMCFGYTGALLLDGKPDEALKLIARATAPDHQLRSLVLCAEWMQEPGPAFDAAQAQLPRLPKSPNMTISFHLLRLSQLAAEKGRPDVAKTFADAIADPGLKAWAAGESVRLRTRVNTNDKASEAWVEVPDSARELRAGHAWGRLWVARHNAKLSHNRDAEKQSTASWPQPIHPFALAGIALGLQDK